ncbi:hypothetical protein [Actinomadura sp. NEAU-AAG7]|uniref:hypothetical protein n=1 Tax=Actinomadura sp. NEAU-AAG7 TaxID=2839640 RepID=UPI001BE44804|nr:hypothetical protein [Actinomadura sp. NEAU-AAG7]MBT2210333.1 hypothetical protein [Actinomadura sp. NEAU-AAG7]
MAPGPDALWELLLSLYRLRRPEGKDVFGPWKRAIRPRVPASARLLTDLIPPAGYAPDFLTPATQTGTLDAGLEALRSTPSTRLAADLSELAARHPGRPTPGWTRALAAGRPEIVGQIAGTAATYFTTCLDPYWPRIRELIDRDRAQLNRQITDGIDHDFLTTVHPSARWSFPVLEMDYPDDHDIALDGRGLVLQPSYFCWGTPITLLDPTLPPVLVYPINHKTPLAAPQHNPA